MAKPQLDVKAELRECEADLLKMMLNIERFGCWVNVMRSDAKNLALMSQQEE